MSVSSSDKKRRFFLFVSIAAVVVLLIVLFSFMLFAPEKKETPTSLRGVKTDNVKGGAGGVGTMEYNDKLTRLDEQKAQEALQAGASHIATPIGSPQLLKKREDTPPPASKTSAAPSASAPAPAPSGQPCHAEEDD